ncbi:MAG: tetrathionate reductase family octaheme c-type cytochrome [Magnetospiraceae bacterium]
MTRLSRCLPVFYRFWGFLVALLLVAGVVAVPGMAAESPGKSTTDHSKLPALQGEFASGPEVTKACLSCHTEAAKQIQKTKHWTWSVKDPNSTKEFGKKNVINNFCGAVSSNEARCTSCHIGYGWEDDTFDFEKETAVDCLVCHDTSGKYRKLPHKAGHPAYEPTEWPMGSGKFIEPFSLGEVARAVGPTSRQNCGACHFLGGGGNAVKHGDLDLSLVQPGKYLDAHMSPDKQDFSCSECHNTDAHAIQGSRYTATAKDTEGVVNPGKGAVRKATCESCHGLRPMKDEKLNDHTDTVACVTCHVPYFARGGYATKMWWDWSTAGELNEKGKPVKRHNELGQEIYSGMKGDFAWGKEVVPEYRWFNGSSDFVTIGDTIDDTKVVSINNYGGSAADPDARIWPFKVMRGKQAYDKTNKTLAVVHTWPDGPEDSTAYWKNYDMEKAVAEGMSRVGQSFSGDLGFVETEMAWPITHMVAPKEDSVTCVECHSDNGRLKDVKGIYMPGRDNWSLLDTAGFGLAFLTLLGVTGHGVARIVTRKNRQK